MAKKKTTARRVPRASEPRMYGDGKPSQIAQQTAGTAAGKPAGVVAAKPAGAAAARSALNGRVPVTVTQDYHYVVNDLRRLGIIAAGTFAVLVAIGFIIR